MLRIIAMAILPLWYSLGRETAAQSFTNDQVERFIDTQLAPQIQAVDPTLKIGPSKCPSDLDPGDPKKAHCSLPVEGLDVPIHVTYRQGELFHVDIDSEFYSTRQSEKYAQISLLGDYGVTATVHCPGPAVSLKKPGTFFTCAVSGSRKVNTVRLQAHENGSLLVWRVPGLPRLNDEPLRLVALHKAGKAAIWDGPAAAAFLMHQMRSISPSSPFEKVNCPKKIDLSGPKRAICFFVINGLAAREALWITDAGEFKMSSLDAIIDKVAVATRIQQAMYSRLEQQGQPLDAIVNCGAGSAVVPLPGAIDCLMTTGGKRYNVNIQLKQFDSAGRLITSQTITEVP
jgi:hypothetical protein